jgi:hypothetical protein
MRVVDASRSRRRPGRVHRVHAPGERERAVSAHFRGGMFGAPWTLCDEYYPYPYLRSPAEAVRVAWDLYGERKRVAIAAEFICCALRTCPVCEGAAYTHGPFLYEYRRVRGETRRERLAPSGRIFAPSVDEMWRAAARVVAGSRRQAPAWEARYPPPPPWGAPSPQSERERWFDEQRREAEEQARERAQEHVRDLALLGLAEGYTRTELRDAHRRLARANHPDKGGAEDDMKRINAARDRLLARLATPVDENRQG